MGKMGLLLNWLSPARLRASLTQGSVVRSPEEGQSGMALPLLVGLGWLLAWVWSGSSAWAQTQPLQWQCGTSGSGAACPANNTYPLPTAQAAAASGGASIFRSVALTNTAVAVKASAGTVSSIYVANYGGSAVTCFLQLYDVAAASVTVGTTTPTVSIALGATTSANAIFSVPLQFSTAISAAATTTAGGSTACNPILSSTTIGYK